MAELIKIFWSFFKIGAFTFGGGYAMIPLIQKEAVERRHWVSDEDILEIVAIAESTPGPIAINAATFVGYRAKGFLGALAATFGVVLPAFSVILAISYVLRRFRELEAVRYAFWGIRAGVLALIIKALVSMYKQSRKNPVSHIIMAFAFLAVAVLDVNVFIVVLICGLVGLLTAGVIGRVKK